MIIALSIFALTLVGKLAFDRHLYLSRKNIHHGKEATLVSLLLLIAGYFADWLFIPVFFFAFWIIFDGLFNILIGQKWNYIGQTSSLDKLQLKYKWLRYFKYIGFFISVIIALKK